MRDFMSNRKPHPLPRLLGIELDLRTPFGRNQSSVGNASIGLDLYLQHLGNVQRVKRRAFPALLTGFQD